MQICDECEAVWPDGAVLEVPGFAQLYEVFTAQGLTESWEHLTEVDEVGETSSV